MYRAVVKLYLKQYQNALIDFQDAYSLMSSSKSYIKDSTNELNESIESDLSDVGLCTLNKYEYQYNSMICWLFIGDYEKSLSLCNSIIENACPEYTNKLYLLRGIILTFLERNSEATTDFTAAKQNDQIAKQFLDKKESVKIEIFPEQGRLCENFAYIRFDCKKKFDPILVFFICLIK